MKRLIVLFLIFQSSAVFAIKQKGQFQSTKFGGTEQNFTGADKTSFSKGSPAYGVELSIDTGGDHIRYFFKTRFNYSVGSQNFIKSGTTYFSKYDYTSISPELGIAFYPVARDEKGVNIYIWGVGSISYNYLSLNSVPNTVNVESKSQEFGSGYGAGIGVEFVLLTTRHSGNRIMVYGELGFRDSTSALAGNNNFEISGMTASFGFGF